MNWLGKGPGVIPEALIYLRSEKNLTMPIPVAAKRAVYVLSRPSPWSTTALVLLGTIILLIGSDAVANSNALFNRAQYSVGTVSATNDQLAYATWAGQLVTVPLITDCKEKRRPPRSGCIAYFEDGDEVLISYDPDYPSDVWIGLVPGGGKATLALAAGIAMVVTGVLGLWWMVVKPRLQALLGLVFITAGAPGKNVHGEEAD